MNYYIADLHFGHANILNFESSNRPYSCVEDMDLDLIKSWNAVVDWDDDVYILGDFCFKSRNHWKTYISQLNGRKHLIIGNHDEKYIRQEEYRDLFDSVCHIKRIYDQPYDIVLCHYPLAEWQGYHRGAYHFYGHVHAHREVGLEIMENYHKGRAFNVGVDVIGSTPLSAKQIIER